MGCSSLESVYIPEGVKSIGSQAFYGCSNISGIDIPSSVRTIGDGAFGHCRSLERLDIPDGVKSIGEGVFSMCYRMSTVYIPESVEHISKNAFEGCESLRDVRYGGTSRQWEELKKKSDMTGNEFLFRDADIGYNYSSAWEHYPMYGDANEDGKVTVSDAVAVLQYIADNYKYPLTYYGYENADCDGEEGITGGDVIAIQKYDAGVIDKFPAESMFISD